MFRSVWNRSHSGADTLCLHGAGSKLERYDSTKDHLHEALFTRYRITCILDPFSYRIEVVFIRLCMNPIRSAPTIPYNFCSESACGTKMNPVQSVPFCFTCKHRNPIHNALKPRFDNRMALMQMRLIDCLANRQRKQQIW